MKNIKAGIIGSGFAARFHFAALKRVYSVNLEIVGAFSINSKKLDEFTIARGIKSFESLQALIEATDVLHVCTPPVRMSKLPWKF